MNSCQIPYKLRQKRQAANNKKGYNVRKCREHNVAGLARSILRLNGCFSDDRIQVKGSNTAVKVVFLGTVVYHDCMHSVKVARFDECWVSALKVIETRLRAKKAACSRAKRKHMQETKRLDQNFGF